MTTHTETDDPTSAAGDTLPSGCKAVSGPADQPPRPVGGASPSGSSERTWSVPVVGPGGWDRRSRFVQPRKVSNRREEKPGVERIAST